MGCAVHTHSQPSKEYSIKDKKAIKQFEQALKAYDVRDMANARTQLESLTAEFPAFMEAQFMLAQVYGDLRMVEQAIVPLEKALALNPTYYTEGWLILAEAHFSLGHYEEADKATTTYIRTPSRSEAKVRRANLILSSCAFAREAMKFPVPFEPVNLGARINTAASEYYPCMTADGQTLLFTRDVTDSRVREGHQEDFYIATRDGEGWSNAQPLREINTVQNEGAPTLSADGSLLIFTACEGIDGSFGGDRTGQGSCDLFFSQRSGNTWSPAKNLGAGINTYEWESQPSFSADGRTLYFIRGRRTAEGIKGQDIFVSELNDEGRWTRPIPIIGKVNTPGEEESVMIHPDGRTLYFSSNGHTGMGGLDIYVSHLQPDGTWGEPLNLGYPINTHRDENSILVTREGDIALFASNRDGGFGGLDLYSFKLHEKVRPDAVTYVKGIVRDALSLKKLEAQFELVDLKTGKKVATSTSDPATGEFLVCIPSGRDYALSVNRQGYLFYSDNFSLRDYRKLEPLVLNVDLQKFRPGSAVVLQNVFFATNSFTLEPESKLELDKLASLLKANGSHRVEIGGHTDNVGKDEDNQKLSENRARTVVEYLVSQGVESGRLTWKGYGEAQPVADNNTPEGRARNRRTEFKILE